MGVNFGLLCLTSSDTRSVVAGSVLRPPVGSVVASGPRESDALQAGCSHVGYSCRSEKVDGGPSQRTRGRRRSDMRFPRPQTGARRSGCIGLAWRGRTRLPRCRRALRLRSRAVLPRVYGARTGGLRILPSNPDRHISRLRANDAATHPGL